MSILGSSYMVEGYYEDDGIGGLTIVTDLTEIIKKRKEGTLYYHDGYSLNKEIDVLLKNLKTNNYDTKK